MEKYLDLKNETDYSKLKIPADIIKKGGIVVFPTETVYGIGTNGLNKDAVRKIYEIKNRNMKNPINLLVNDMKMVESLTKNITELEYKLMKEFFPGALTIILEKNDIVPDIVTANEITVGIRMSSSKVVSKLIEFAGVPIAAPSANISGNITGTTFENIYNDFKDKVDYMIDGGNSSIGIESTIIKVIDNIPHILRPGSITYDDIIKISGVAVKTYEDRENKNINSDKQYKMKSKSILVCSDDEEKKIQKIKEIAGNYKNAVILATTENKLRYGNIKTVEIGKRNELDKIGRCIFDIIKKADEFKPDIILIEGIKEEAIGIAIMNRLKKVCNYNIIKI